MAFLRRWKGRKHLGILADRNQYKWPCWGPCNFSRRHRTEIILVLLNCNHIALYKSVSSLSVEFLISESFKVKEGHLFKISPFQKWHFPWSYEVETGLIRKSASRKPSMQVFSLIQLSADFIEFFEIFSGFNFLVFKELPARESTEGG